MQAEVSTPLARLRERGRGRGLRTQAQKLRQQMTEAEIHLWYHLRANRLDGYKFKRQHPIGPYIVDFVSLENWLVIEVDGSQHLESPRDQERDRWLSQQGFRMLHFWNHDVLRDTESVLTQILLDLKNPSPPTPPPHAGEGSQT